MSDNIPTQQDPAPFAVTVSFTAKQLADVLSAALESGAYGSGQWLKILKMVPPPADAPQWRSSPELGSFPHLDYPLSGGCLKVKDTESGKTHTLDRAAIERGVALLPSKSPRVFAAMVKGEYDAAMADVFVQCCVLGDVIYG